MPGETWLGLFCSNRKAGSKLLVVAVIMSCVFVSFGLCMAVAAEL